MSNRHVGKRKLLSEVRREAAHCRRGPLWMGTTQTLRAPLLRIPDADSRKAKFGRFVEDLTATDARRAAR